MQKPHPCCGKLCARYFEQVYKLPSLYRLPGNLEVTAGLEEVTALVLVLPI